LASPISLLASLASCSHVLLYRHCDNIYVVKVKVAKVEIL
jgi:hypothetical protein